MEIGSCRCVPYIEGQFMKKCSWDAGDITGNNKENKERNTPRSKKKPVGNKESVAGNITPRFESVRFLSLLR